MRTIKFRAWDRVLNRWIYFTLERLNDEDDTTNTNTDLINWQQFTGLHDKNSKEIYEGDIINIYDDEGKELLEVDIIEYCHNGFWPKNYDCECGLPNTEDSFEVIGNIFENPELINK